MRTAIFSLDDEKITQAVIGQFRERSEVTILGER